MYYMNIFESSIGTIYLKARDNVLVGLSFELYDLEIKDLEIFDKVSLYLEEYFKGKNPSINFDFILENLTLFQKSVLETLFLNIKYGERISYKELGFLVSKNYFNNKAISFRAIGGALNKNPIAIIIPCHRVIGSDGSLKGYRYGLDKKKYLLNLEETSSK